ncbi:unnamed protein product [Closterium sp. NIES-53]
MDVWGAASVEGSLEECGGARCRPSTQGTQSLFSCYQPPSDFVPPCLIPQSFILEDATAALPLWYEWRQAKIADFGLVKLSAGTTVAATRVMGTPGYVDPAYCKSHKATPMADVYSFWVVMLAVITGRKAMQEVEGGHVNLKKWVEPLVASNSIAAFKDPRLDAPDDILLRLARLALSCTTKPTASRPSMGKVLGELVAVRGEIVGEEVDKVASRIDSEIDTSSDLDFNASIARAHQIAMQSGSSDTV